ncbi:MAG: alpha/beta fold hydrolase [Parachlamydiaceae bacterium]|nr:alpha/beta fold hydrolase [Parachlamydiaceae bacterium]
MKNFLRRYQEPLFPYSYHEKEVIFLNKIDNVQLSGTLTLPNTDGPYPAVILLHGSAPLDRDASMFGHKLFLVWADHLTRQGIAVLRFDKRSAGKSTGNYNASTLEDFANDALAGLEYLETQKDINPDNIGLVGHSEGGMTALLTATKSKSVSFIVLMACPCVNWEELVLAQELAFQRVDGVPKETMIIIQKLRQGVFNILKNEENRERAEIELREFLTQTLSNLSPSERQVAETYYGPLENQVHFFNSAWFRYNFAYDPAITLKKIQVPLLALNGELDLVVSPNLNLNRIEKTLKELGHQDHEIIELLNLNHAFQTCKTGSVTECEKIEETTAPEALKKISEWILEKTDRI